eukprot:TRINITY_DN6171_c0_g1_i1.p1 TRINITY_DN6171_c0_g1~~TRINITY_DN6171_c0_g1_i1.p1  ORF type:complete len:569 (-),score=107.38 TRINITY_DN6171_c0_g1_i1:50-1756(-)
MTSFFDYEVSNNRILKKIRDNEEREPIVQYILQNEASILVPQDVTLEPLNITGDFLESHVIITNPKNTHHFVTMNGILGVFSPSKDKIFLISVPISKRRESGLNPLIDPFTVFSTEKEQFESFNPANKHGIHILREGQVEYRKNHINILLISEPVMFEGCEWSIPIKTTPKREPRDNSPKSSSVLANAQNNRRSLPVGSNILKPTKGIRDFLSQFGSGPNSESPLFPEQPESPPVTPQPPPKNWSTVFFEKLKHRTAAEIVKALRSFVASFPTQPLETLESQGNVVRIFLANVERIITDHPLWKDASEDEMEGVTEGLEKYITTKLFDVTFNRDVANSKENEILHERIQSLGFLTPEHLEIRPAYVHDATIQFACSELLKINNYRTPRDKSISVLNCCKVIYTLINKTNPEGTGVDEFLPILIHVVIQANPKNLDTNMQFIQYFRSPSKMNSEAGYYCTNLISAITFLKMMDHTGVKGLSKEEFENLREKEFLQRKQEKFLITRSLSLPDIIQNKSEISPRNSEKTHLFMDMDVDDLKISDVAKLLDEYKKLVVENEKLKNELKNINV